MVKVQTDPSSSVSAFYAGQSILITGATGFMGKVLVEKLLRSTPDVQEIFLLMRPKKSISIDDRLRKMLALPLFDRLRKENPSSFEKLIPVTGNVMDEGLGIPAIERKVLIERVSIIFHVAANVRFDDSLKDAVLMNTRGTRDVCILAANMKKLVAFLHVSTTYSNCDKPFVDEKLYPPHADWKKTIKIAETVDDHTLRILTAKYLRNLPNTYVFTKQLAEHVVNDYAGILPAVIFRPSVVIASVDEPMPGWIDNFNGPMGLLIGGGKGVLRTFYADPSSIVDFIPVDVSIKVLMLTAWKRGIKPLTVDPNVDFYNCAASKVKKITTREMIDMGHQINEQYPLEGIIWAPHTTINTNRIMHYIYMLILHLIPALIIDGILKMSGAKPMLVRLQRKVYTANGALEYFIWNSFTFPNNKLMDLLQNIPEVDKAEFDYDYINFDIREYFKNGLIGCKIYLLKEDIKNLEEAKAHFKKMWWIDRALKVWLMVVLAWLTWNSGLTSYLTNSVRT